MLVGIEICLDPGLLFVLFSLHRLSWAFDRLGAVE